MKNTIWIRNNHFTPLAMVMMIVLPLATALICLCIGRMNLSVGDVADTLIRAFLHGDRSSQNYSIVVNLRLPRILMAVIVGAGLTCAGDTFQSLFSNPLATPDILGVTSGTCVGAILAILLSKGILETQIIALIFGLASVWVTIRLAGNKDGQSVVFLVLSGVIISSLFNAIGSLLKYTADPSDKLPEITYWLMGSFTSASYQKIMIGSPLIFAGIIVIYLLRVSMCGQVGWIGLLIPHCARMLTGSNNRFVIPVSISLGASFMIVIDTLSRSISVIELPLSVLTAIIGAPVFISLLKKNRGTLK